MKIFGAPRNWRNDRGQDTFHCTIMSDGLRMFSAHPLFGTVLGALRIFCPAWISPTMNVFYTDSVHCDPIEFAVDAMIPVAAFHDAMFSILDLAPRIAAGWRVSRAWRTPPRSP